MPISLLGRDVLVVELLLPFTTLVEEVSLLVTVCAPVEEVRPSLLWVS